MWVGRVGDQWFLVPGTNRALWDFRVRSRGMVIRSAPSHMPQVTEVTEIEEADLDPPPAEGKRRRRKRGDT